MGLKIHSRLSLMTHLVARNERNLIAIAFVIGLVLQFLAALPDWLQTIDQSISAEHSVWHSLEEQARNFREHWQTRFREIAHFLFSSSALIAILLTYLRQSGTKLDYFRARFMIRNHTLICGLSTRSAILADDLASKGHAVVVLDLKDDSPAALQRRQKGVCVVQGNATDPLQLINVGIRRARNVVCLTDRDETNIAITETVRKILEADVSNGKRCEAMECFCHVRSPSLNSHLEQLSQSHPAGKVIRIRPFNIESITAAELLLRYPPERHIAKELQASSVHVALLGGGNFALALAVQMAQQCHYWREDFESESFPRTRLTIIDAAGESLLKTLRNLCPQIDALLELQALNYPPESGEAIRWYESWKSKQISQFYVAQDNEVSTLALARRLAQVTELCSDELPGQIVAVIPATLSRIDPFVWRDSKSVDVFESYESCKEAVIIGGERDQLARQAHESYLAKELKRGAEPGSKPSLVSWAELNEFLRNSNRQQIAHQRIKKRLIECAEGIGLSTGSAESDIQENDLEYLAEMEHRRWMAFYMIRGWKFSEKRDEQLLRHDCLKPYRDLSEAVREYDLLAVLASFNLSDFSTH